MHAMQKLLIERISTGLQRRALTQCSAWAETYRVMGQPYPGAWRFDHHPWLRQMHDDRTEQVVGQKAAQMGFTETCLNKTFFTIDIIGGSVLYVLPNQQPDAADFSTSRFDPALESSIHLQQIFSDVKNIRHKRAGSANLFIRGSKSRSQLKSVPVSLIILDEVEEMDQDNIPLAFERTSGQVHKQVFMLSTPTVAGHGINKYYRDSSQMHYFFRCPHCRKMTEFVFPDCLEIASDDMNSAKVKDSFYKCKECKHRLEQEEKAAWLIKGEWVAAYPDRLAAGYTINQMYSPTIQPYEIAISYLKGLQNYTDEQEFYNSKLGMVHEVKGARVTDEDIVACTYGGVKALAHPRGGVVTMGVDVGSRIHYEVDLWQLGAQRAYDINLAATPTVLMEGSVQNFEDLDKLMIDYNVTYCVIDIAPERRKALEFAQRFSGRVKLCLYIVGLSGRNIVTDDSEMVVKVDRTSWLDLSLGRFGRNTIRLPKDLSLEYKGHVKAPVRSYEKDKLGNPIGVYKVAQNTADHLAHARNYAEIAFRCAAGALGPQNIKDY